MAWFVYLARCADGSLYTGVTTDPARRERAHNEGRGAAYTRSRRPVRLVHLEPAPDRGAALRRELAIKRLSREGKEELMGRGGAGTQGRRFPGFSAEAIRFLRRLRRNNRKDWFEQHRAVYETAVRDPMRALVEEMDVRLARIAPELMGDPRRSVLAGASMKTRRSACAGITPAARTAPAPASSFIRRKSSPLRSRRT